MKKLGLVFDSTCGLSKVEAESKGIGFIPLNVIINDVEYGAGDNLFQDDLYKLMENRNTVIRTSLPGLEAVEHALDIALENAEHVVYVGMSHKFSGTQNAIRLMVQQDDKYKDRVTVAETEFSSPWMPLYAKELTEMINDYEDPKEFCEMLKKANDFMIGYLSPGDIWWFYKGGRISKMQYMVGSIAKINPILKVAEGEINKSQTLKSRGVEKALLKITEVIKDDIESLKIPNGFHKFIVLDTGNAKILELSLEIAMRELKITKEDIVITGLTTEQTAHMGPDSFGIAIYVSLKNIINGGLR